MVRGCKKVNSSKNDRFRYEMISETQWAPTFDSLRGELKLENFENYVPLIHFVTICCITYFTVDSNRKNYPNKQDKYIDV